MWKFSGKTCLNCNIRCCDYYDTLDLQEVDIDNILALGLCLDKHINVDMRGKVVLKLNPCPFLKDDLCIIHREYGLRYKPLRCQFYPYNPKIVNGKVRISLFKGCPAVECGREKHLDQIKKGYLDNYSEHPTMYKLLYKHYLTNTALVDFSRYFWNNVDVTKESVLAFSSYLLLFSKQEHKILNKNTIKKYLNKNEIHKRVDLLKYSTRAKIAKIIIDIHSIIITKIIGIKYPMDDDIKKRTNHKVMNNYISEKVINISESCLFTNYVAMLPDMYAIQNLKNKIGDESFAIKIFETQRGFSGFKKKRLIYLLNYFLPWIIFTLCQSKKQ